MSNVLGEVGEVAEAPSRAPSAAAPSAAAAPAPVAAPQQTAEGSLPFTGLDLGIVAGLGLLLVVAGVGLRRLNASNN